jgi:hypothetical protein
MVDETKTLMGTDYKMRVDFTIDDWTWLCHLLSEALHKKQHCEDCREDLEEVLSVIEAGEAVHDR